ncbi:hypothetical protein DO70_4697 [Burkholderia pseudomallei]|nr:hypothetical protein DO70_4697 [Burkholderia pseudomallei]
MAAHDARIFPAHRLEQARRRGGRACVQRARRARALRHERHAKIGGMRAQRLQQRGEPGERAIDVRLRPAVDDVRRHAALLGEPRDQPVAIDLLARAHAIAVVAVRAKRVVLAHEHAAGGREREPFVAEHEPALGRQRARRGRVAPAHRAAPLRDVARPVRRLAAREAADRDEHVGAPRGLVPCEQRDVVHVRRGLDGEAVAIGAQRPVHADRFVAERHRRVARAQAGGQERRGDVEHGRMQREIGQVAAAGGRQPEPREPGPFAEPERVDAAPARPVIGERLRGQRGDVVQRREPPLLAQRGRSVERGERGERSGRGARRRIVPDAPARVRRPSGGPVRVVRFEHEREVAPGGRAVRHAFRRPEHDAHVARFVRRQDQRRRKIDVAHRHRRARAHERIRAPHEFDAGGAGQHRRAVEDPVFIEKPEPLVQRKRHGEAAVGRVLAAPHRHAVGFARRRRARARRPLDPVARTLERIGRQRDAPRRARRMQAGPVHVDALRPQRADAPQRRRHVVPALARVRQRRDDPLRPEPRPAADQIAQRAPRPDFDEYRRVERIEQRAHPRVKLHGLAHVLAPVTGVPQVLLVQPAPAAIRDQRNARGPAHDALARAIDLARGAVHRRRMERMRGREALARDAGRDARVFERGDPGGVAGEHVLLGAVDRRDLAARAVERRELARIGQHREHRARRLALHRVGPRDDERQRVGQRERLADGGRDELADAMADHRVRRDAPCEPLPRERVFDRKQRRLRIARFPQQRRIRVEHQRADVPVQMRAKQLRAAIDFGLEYAAAPIQRRAHAGILAALAGKHEHHRRRSATLERRRRAGGVELGGRVGGRVDDGEAAMLERGAPDLQRMGDVLHARPRVRERVAQLPPLLAQRARRTRRNRQQLPARRLGRFARAHARRLLQHHVDVRAADAERADARAARRRRSRPRAGFAHDAERRLVEADSRVRRLAVDARRNRFAMQRENRLDEPRDAGRRVEMADVALDRADPAPAVRQRARRGRLGEGLRERAHLDRIAERRARAVRFDVADAVGRHARRAQRVADHGRLAGDARRGVAHLVRAVVVRRRALDHRVHGVAVAQRRVEPLEQHHAAAAAARGAGRGGVERPAAPVRRHDPAFGVQIADLIGIERDRAGERHLRLAVAQARASQMDRHQRRRARGADAQRRPEQIELVRGAGRDEILVVADQPLARLEPQPLGIRHHVLHEVIVERGAREHADRAHAAAIAIAGLLERLPRELEEDPLLRVHHLRLAGRIAEKAGVELRLAFELLEAADEMRIAIQLGRHAVRVEFRVAQRAARLVAGEQPLPETVEVRRVGKAAGEADHGDRVGVEHTVGGRARGSAGCVVGRFAVARRERVEMRGERADRRMLEEIGERDHIAERFGDALVQRDRAQRMPARVEEVFVVADVVAFEQRAPDLAHAMQRAPLRRGTRHVGRRRGGARRVARLQRLQRLQIRLARAAGRQRIEEHERRGHHRVRHLAAQRVEQFGLRAARDDIPDEQRLPARVRLRERLRRLHAGHFHQRGAHRVELDAKAPDLHLAIDAADELDRAVVEPAHHVARAIHARARLGVERIGDERLRGARRLPEVALRDARAADEQLARRAGGRRAQRFVEHVQPRAAHRPQDQALALRVVIGQRHDDRGLRGPVAVQQPASGRPSLRELARAGFAGHDQHLERRQRGLGHHRQRGRHDPHMRHALRVEPIHQRLARQRPAALGEHDRRACDERRKDLAQHDVEHRRHVLRHSRLRPDAHDLGHRAHVVAHARVRDGDTLRPARRARRVDHVRAIVRVRAARRGRVGELRCGRRRRVEIDDGQPEAARRIRGPRAADERRQRRVVHDMPVPLRLVLGVHRHERGAEARDREHRRHVVRMVADEDPDPIAATHAVRRERARGGRHALGQLRVARAQHRAVERDALRMARRAAREEAEQVVRRWPARARRVIGELRARLMHVMHVMHVMHLMRLVRRARLCRLALRVRARRAARRPQEVMPDRAQRIGIERSGARHQMAHHAAVAHVDRHFEIELRRVRVERERMRVDARQLQPLVVEFAREDRLEHRIAPRGPRGLQRLDEILERHVAVLVEREALFAHVSQHALEGVEPVQAHAQRHRVREEAEHVGEPFVRAQRERRADREVRFAGLLPQRGGEKREVDDERRAVRAPRERGETRGDVIGHLERQRSGAAGRVRRGHRVGQRQRCGQAAQLLAPICELPRGRFAAQRLPLPAHEIRMAPRRALPAGRLARDASTVRGLQIAPEQAERRPVDHDMVDRHVEHVMRRRNLEQHRAQQRPRVQIERAAVRLAQPRGQARRVVRCDGHPPQRDRQRIEHPLRRLLRRFAMRADDRAHVRRKHRAQRIVARDHIVDRPLQRVRVERAVEAPRHRDVVAEIVRRALRRQPQALLRIGQQPVVARRLRGVRVRRLPDVARRARGRERFDEPRLLGDARMIEDARHADRDVERLTDARGEARGRERMSAALEEVLVHARHARRQQGFPQREQAALDVGRRVGRRDVRRAQRPGLEPVPVDLAAHRERHVAQPFDRGGQHVRGQTPAQIAAQRRDRRVAHDERRERRVARRLVAHDDRALAHVRMRGEHALDLAQLDAKAADLDLVVAAPQEIDRAVFEEPADIAGAIKARLAVACDHAPVLVHAAAEEFLRGQRVVVQVARRHRGARDEQFARHADRRHLQQRIDDQQFAARQRPPERHDAIGRERVQIGIEVRTVDRRLGHAVRTEHARVRPAQRARRVQLVPEPYVGAAHERVEHVEPLARLVAMANQLAQDHRREIAERHTFGAHQRVQPAGVEQPVARRHDERAAACERAAHVADAQIERHAGELQRDRMAGLAEPIGAMPAVIRHVEAAVRDLDAFRLAGRSGRIDHIGRIGFGKRREVEFGVARRRVGHDVGRDVGHYVVHRVGRFPAFDRVVDRQRAGAQRLRHVLEIAPRRHDHRGRGVLDFFQPSRVRRIERQIRGARLQDTQVGDDDLLRIRLQRRHPAPPADAARPQRARERIRAAIERLVRHPRVAVHDRHRVRRAPRRFANPLRHRRERNVRVRLVGPREAAHLPQLVGGQQRALGDRRGGRSQHVLEQSLEMPAQAGNRARIEQIRVVFDDRRQLVGAFLHRDRQVVLRRARVDERAGHADAVELEHAAALQVVEHDLEHRRVARRTRRTDRIDDLVERQHRVLECIERRLAHLREQVEKIDAGIETHAQRDQVDEEADQALLRLRHAVRERAADHDLVLARIAMQQRGERGDAQHVGRHAGTAAKRADALGMPAREHVLVHRAAHARRGRTRPVGGQLVKRRRARHRARPVLTRGGVPGGRGHARRDGRRVVERRQIGRRAREQRAIDGAELPEEDPDRPVVEHDVMHVHRQHMLVFAEPEQQAADRRVPLEIEPAVRVVRAEPLGRPRAHVGIERAEVLPRQRRRLRRELDAQFAVARAKPRAQRGMPLLHERQRPLEHGVVERPRQGEGGRHVVSRRAHVAVLDEPEPALRDARRQRERRLLAGGGFDGRFVGVAALDVGQTMIHGVISRFGQERGRLRRRPMTTAESAKNRSA